MDTKKLVEAKSGYVALLSSDGSENKVLFLESGGLPCDVDPELPMPIRGLREIAYRTNDVAYDNDFMNSEWVEYMPDGHVVLDNVLFTPLNINKKTVGIIGVANKDGGFTSRDVEIARSFGDLAAVALTYSEYEDKLAKSLQGKETLLKELNHRVKNNMQVIISLLRLQSDKIGDEQLKNYLLDTQNRIYAMSAVHETLHQSDNLSSVDLSEYLTKLSDTTFETYRTDTGNVQFSAKIKSIPVDLEKSYPIGLVINELLSNSLKYAFPDGHEGKINITGELEENTVKLVVSDTGVGIPQEFDWRTTDSLGLQLVRSLVEEQLQGTVELGRTEGTKWSITFPV